MQSVPDYTMSTAPSPTALSSLQDFLSSSQFHHSTTAGGGVTSPSGDFADLLAEFTLPSNALSPESNHPLGKSPEPSGGHATGNDMEGIAFGASFGDHQRQREKSAQEVLLEQLGFPVSQLAQANSATASSSSSGSGNSKDQVNQAIANMDASTRSQLLNALLTLKQQSTGNSPAGSNPSPRPQPAQSPRGTAAPALNSPRYNEASPLGYSSQPPSQHNSPQPFNAYNSPHPLHQQHALPFQPLPAALNTSLPPSAVSSPVASPYLHATHQHNYYAAQVQAQQQAQQQQQVFTSLPSVYQNAFSPRPFDPTQQQQQHQLPPDAQTQLAMEMLARVGGHSGAPDMSMRGGSATGGSYATTAADGEEWGDNDFIFSPLMSPALTPQSVFTQASSVPTSGAFMPGSLVSPAEFFSPLGSPAIMPQQFADDPNLWQQQQQQHRNSLQGLVDQTRALGFDGTNLAALQAQANGSYGSPSSYMPQGQPGNGMSPRLGPNDAGTATGAGSGRRGAGSKKTRPSPLLKPTPDGQLRRKKAGGGGASRSASIGSAGGGRSATTSPFLGPQTTSKPNSVASSGMAQSSGSASGSGSNNSGSQKATPPEDTAGGINTPSPVDLTMGEVPSSSYNAGYQPELMGPPPPPSSTDSRRQSFTHYPHAYPPPIPAANGASDWLGPVTPASFMNLPTDFNVNDLSALTPGLLPTSGSSSSASSSTPQPIVAGPSSLPNLPTIAPAPAPRYKQPKLLAKPSTTTEDLAVDGGGSSPVLGATGASKGKGKAASGSATGKKATANGKNVKASPRVGPTTKIKPLLANGAAPDALSRLSTKSNYQNIVEGHGDLLGLDPSTVSSLSTAPSTSSLPVAAATSTGNGPVGADNRRTSHKAAEQKRRDSLKARFEELRILLPPIALTANEERRPGEGNVGGQRSGSIDPDNPNRGVSKVALLRRSNEYMGMLLERVERRDRAIGALRSRMREMREQLGMVEDEEEEEVEGLDLDHLDRDEKEAGTMAFYENLSDDDEPSLPKAAAVRKASTARRKSTAALDADGKPGKPAARRSARKSNLGDETTAMEVEA